MNKCEWCSKLTKNTVEYIDAFGAKRNICKNCYDKYVGGCTCRKCGTDTDTSVMINGLCISCLQIESSQKNKQREEILNGVGAEISILLSSELEFSDEDYEQWLTLNKTYGSADAMSSNELKRLWILIKLRASGVYNDAVIMANMSDIMELMDRNFTKLVGNKCSVIIAEDSDTRAVVRNSEVIDNKNKSYIIKV